MPALVRAEVGGIQKFIFATGKLKEMIGGSEIVFQICQPEFYEDILRSIGCARKAAAETTGNDWNMLLQGNAGVLALLLPDEEKGAAFLQSYSRKALEEFPGLPLFGSQAPCAWNTESYGEARSLVERRISIQRRSAAAGAGLPMLPILRASRLDGLPAVAEERSGDNKELISLPSWCKRKPRLLKDSEKRLQEYAGDPKDVIWQSDMEAMFPNGEKIALIHMDGNSMGKLFGQMLNEAQKLPLGEGVRLTQALSTALQDIIQEAFSYAVQAIIAYIRHNEATPDDGKPLTMPMRPLVIGGDDITVIIRADLALLFVHLFVGCYERLAKAKGYSLSMGVGMVVMDPSWPFVKAFGLAEDLTKNAKKITASMGADRPSSLDYLVITEEVDKEVSDLRRRVYTASDGLRLTGKPFRLMNDFLGTFLEKGQEILETLPRSAMRPAFVACRKGREAAKEHWLNTRENLERRLGGRKGRLMQAGRFEELFPENYFQKEAGYTLLGDYLELSRLLPAEPSARAALLGAMRQGGERNV